MGLILLGAECVLVVLVLLLYRAEGKASFGAFLVSRPGLLWLTLLIGFTGMCAGIVWYCVRDRRAGARRWIFTLSLNGILVGATIVLGESVLRMATVSSNTEERIAGRLLYPRQWDTTSANFRRILGRMESELPFWVEDPRLGWAIGPSRQDSSGLYRSSAEGLRSDVVGSVLNTGQSSGCRIAFVGDSFTFGEEVTFENAWVHILGRELKSKCQVLNFAVGGYGVDQMYLRYLKDIRDWNPDVVVLAFVNHDVVRTLSIYSFLLFPEGETPFAKPRFVVTDGGLEQINYPLPSPESLFLTPAIQSLPRIDYDREYRESEWDRSGWGFAYKSYMFRLLLSLYPLHERERQEISDEVLQEVNTELLRAFRNAVNETGAESLIVYLPSVDEVPERLPWIPIGQRILREGGIPHVDIRDCMAEGFTPEMFMPQGHGQHYSPTGNQVAAACLAGPVHDILDRVNRRDG